MLEILSVTGGYDDTVVLRDVDLVVPDGAVIALLGPNGAGKTTTLRLVSGLIRPMSGEVWLDGEDISALRPAERVKLGVCHIPEGRGIFPSLTVRDNFIVQAGGGDLSEVIDRASATFPILGQRLNQQAGTLSGGEQQMLAMARAYDPRARLVLVDEASLGLAPLVVDHIFDYLSGLTAEGKSLLIVEQYVSRALELADYAYLLSRGRLVHEGPADEMKSDEVFASYMGTEIGVV